MRHWASHIRFGESYSSAHETAPIGMKFNSLGVAEAMGRIGTPQISIAIRRLIDAGLDAVESDDEHRALAPVNLSSNSMPKYFMIEIIKAAGRIKHRDLTRKTQQLSRQERLDIIDNLIETGQVEATKNGKTRVYSLSERTR